MAFDIPNARVVVAVAIVAALLYRILSLGMRGRNRPPGRFSIVPCYNNYSC